MKETTKNNRTSIYNNIQNYITVSYENDSISFLSLFLFFLHSRRSLQGRWFRVVHVCVPTHTKHFCRQNLNSWSDSDYNTTAWFLIRLRVRGGFSEKKRSGSSQKRCVGVYFSFHSFYIYYTNFITCFTHKKFIDSIGYWKKVQ